MKKSRKQHSNIFKKMPAPIVGLLVTIGGLAVFMLVMFVFIGFMVDYQNREGKRVGLEYATKKCQQSEKYSDEICDHLTAKVRNEYETRIVEVFYPKNRDEFDSEMTILFGGNGFEAGVHNYLQLDAIEDEYDLIKQTLDHSPQMPQ